MPNKFLTALHRLFDPTVRGAASQTFSLKYPPEQDPQPADLSVKTETPTAPDTPLGRLRVRAGAAVDQIDEAMEVLQTDLTSDADLTLGRLKETFHFDRNADMVARRIDLPFDPPVKAYLLFATGVVDSEEVDRAIILPLMQLPRGEARLTGLDLLRLIDRSLLPGRQTEPVFTLSQAASGVAGGQCALVVDGAPGVLLIDQRKFPSRAVEQPFTEQVVRGPQDGFTENLLTNTGLLRHRLKTPDLILELAEVGRQSRTSIMICYLDNVVNPALVAEVRRRIQALDVDSVQESGTLEQLLEDSPYGLLPTLQETQRPDRAAAALAEGRVLLLTDGTPYALIAPVVFSDFLHNPEDYYIKWPFGTILRLIRIFGLMVTLLLPAAYIAIANYHQEMIPSSLLLAIAASRENVPFPAPAEVLMMEVAFEIIREGSLRIPTVLGQTVGIVGALILGQAAVQANIVSPILVIVVATTALGSFTIPNYSMSLPVRFGRFFFIILGASFGLYGVAAGLFLVSAHAVSLRSFGVPYLSPSGPRIPGNPDVVIRGPTFGMNLRPELLRTRNPRSQGKEIMRWNPALKETGSAPTGGSSTDGGARH